MKYEASIICVVFDKKGAFEDILHIGIAHSPTEARLLLMKDIWRVMEVFGDGKCEVEEIRSEYDESITAVTTNSEDSGVNYWHYYCLHNKQEGEAEASI